MKVLQTRERLLSKNGVLKFHPVKQTICVYINSIFITIDSGYGNFIQNIAFMKDQGFIDYQSGTCDLSGLLTKKNDFIEVSYQYEDEGEKS